jgi:hypothetical protein
MSKKEAYYFSHDSNAASDPKIVQMLSVYGFEGYGWYWRLIEVMRDQKDYKIDVGGKYSYQGLANTCSTDPEQMLNFVKDCVEHFKLFTLQENFLSSKSLVARMGKKEDIRRKRSEAGKKSAEKRKKLSNKINGVEKQEKIPPTNVQQVLNKKGTLVEQGKERKGKEIKDNKEKNTKKEKYDFECDEDKKFFEAVQEKERIFDEVLWPAYPTRDGRKNAKQEARNYFTKKFPHAKIKKLVIAVENMAKANAEKQIVGIPDFVRFMRKKDGNMFIEPWLEWLEPVKSQHEESMEKMQQLIIDQQDFID